MTVSASVVTGFVGSIPISGATGGEFTTVTALDETGSPASSSSIGVTVQITRWFFLKAPDSVLPVPDTAAPSTFQAYE